MKKLAHVPIQTWRGWDPNDLLGGWFSALGIQNPDGAMGLILEACLILPCLVPLVLGFIKIIITAVIERKTATHVIIL
jgi:hypothetical protein